MESLVLGPDFTGLLSRFSSPLILPPQAALEIEGRGANKRGEESGGGVGGFRGTRRREKEVVPYLPPWDSNPVTGKGPGVDYFSHSLTSRPPRPAGAPTWAVRVCKERGAGLRGPQEPCEFPGGKQPTPLDSYPCSDPDGPHGIGTRGWWVGGWGGLTQTRGQ